MNRTPMEPDFLEPPRACHCCGFEVHGPGDYCTACRGARGAQRAYWGRHPDARRTTSNHAIAEQVTRTVRVGP